MKGFERRAGFKGLSEREGGFILSEQDNRAELNKIELNSDKCQRS